MRELQFNVADGIDALCELLPGLSKHEHSLPLRNLVLKTAAGLLSGELANALIMLQLESAESDVIVIGDSWAIRAKLLHQYRTGKRLGPCQILSFPSGTPVTPDLATDSDSGETECDDLGNDKS